MIRLSDYLINSDLSILCALDKLNKLSAAGLTLFVVNADNKLIGSITDGDIRRALVSGACLTDTVVGIMNGHPMFLTSNDSISNVYKYRQCRLKNINAIPVIDENGCVVDVRDVHKYQSCIDVSAVLMAGGKGIRLRPLTEHCPKPLLKVGSKAIIDYNIERLASYGVRDMYVTVNYLKEQIISHFTAPIMDVQVKCVVESDFLGTIGAVSLIPELRCDTVLVMNSDLFSNIDFEAFYLHFIENNADMSVAVVPYSVSIPYGIVNVDGHNIVGLQEKPVYNYYANAGMYMIKKKMLSYIPENKVFNATDMIQLLIEQKKNVIRFPISGYWIDIGKKEEYDKACDIARHWIGDY